MANLPYFSALSIIFFATFFLSGREVKSAGDLIYDVDITKFSPGSVTLQGNASITKDGILALTDHTKPHYNIGRALLPKPLNLWDRSTGNVASFITGFSFVVKDYTDSTSPPADGIIFFLAPPNSQIPDSSTGGNLGVVDPNNAFNNFVGVEFDNYLNEWDPKYIHVGINANSLISLKTVRWNRVSGALVTVTVSYDSLSHILNVIVVDDTGVVSNVAQVVDLKDVLPESVSIGLSATTTDDVQLHDIHSWYFKATSETSRSTTFEKIASYYA